MLTKEFYEKLKEEIKPYFEKIGSHDFSHTERVYHNAMRIADGMDVDMDIVRATALLHDISRLKEDEVKSVNHADDGAIVAREILEKTEFAGEKIEAVQNAIRTHRYSRGMVADEIEGKILQDADRLDALGAIIIARIFDFGRTKNRPLYDPNIPPRDTYDSDGETSINHFYEKIFKITPESFNTPNAQELAKGKYTFVKEFVERFEKEWRGEL